MNKTVVKTFVLGMVMTTTTTAAFANVTGLPGASNTVLVAPATNGNTGSFLGEAGNYTVRTYDQTKIESILLQLHSSRQEQDLAFIKKAQAEITQNLKGIVDELNRPAGLVDLSVQSSTSGGAFVLTLQQYVGAQQTLLALINKVNADVQGIVLLPSLLNSQQTLSVDQAQAMVPAPLKVELSSLQKYYNDQLGSALSQVSNSIFFVTMPNGARQQITGINFSLSSVPLNAKVLADMNTDILHDRAALSNADYRNMVNELNRQALSEIRTIRSNFGTKQIYRFNLNKDGRDMNFERLAQIFMARDYLRYTYGIQLGAIGITYDTMFANLDVVFKSSKNIMNLFVADFATDTPALIDFQNAIALAKNTEDMRIKEVFGEGVGILERGMSAIEFVKGQTQLATVNAFVLALLDRDVAHELMLTKSGGAHEMRDAFRAIYAANPEIEGRTREQIKEIKKLINHEVNDDVEGDVNGIQGGTFNGSLRIAIGGLENMVFFIEQANQKDAGLQALKASCKACTLTNKKSDF